MATVIYLPKDPREEAISRALTKGVSGYFGRQREEKQRKELAEWLQKAQQSPDRETLLQSPMPSAFKGAKGAAQYSSIIEGIHPQKFQQYVIPTDPRSTDPRTLQSVGRHAAGRQPEGSIALDVAKVTFRMPTGKGGKDTPTKLKAQVLRKMTANDTARAAGRPEPFKLTPTENRLVESEFADPTQQSAVQLARDSVDYYSKHKTASAKLRFIERIRKQLERKGPLSKIMDLPPSVSEEDISAIQRTPKYKGKSREAIRKLLWEQYDAGKRFDRR